MVKFAGFILLIISSGLIGIAFSDTVKLRCSHLRKIVSVMTEIEIQIRYNAVTIKELFAHLREQSDFSDVDIVHLKYDNCRYHEEISNKIDKSSMKLLEDEKTNLKNFFIELGSSDIDGQLAIISQCKAFFSQKLETSLSESGNKCRLYKSMGFLGGAFLAVILI